MQIFHIWDITNYSTKLTVNLETEFLKMLKCLMHEKYGSSAATARAFCLNKWSTTDWLKGRRPINLQVLIKFLKDLDLDKGLIEMHMIDFGLNRFRILKPKFPIIPNPIFASILVNLIGDGCLIGNDTGFFHYGDIESHKIIAEKVFHIIGIPKHKTTGIYVPSILIHIIKKYYNVTFPCKKLPAEIIEADKWTKLACITAFTNDEGCITPNFIHLCSKNKLLLRGMVDICKSLGYSVSSVYVNKKDISNFRINSPKKFYFDYKKLVEKYYETRLISRKENILKLVNINYLNGCKFTTRELQDKIISVVSDEPKNIYKLVKDSSIRISTLRRHLHNLKAKNLVLRQKVGHSYFYKLDKFVS
jgi:hypothetical protein